MGKRIRDAEKEWVPYVLVIGDKEEADPSNLTVRVRGLGEKKLARDSLKEEISEKVSGKPFLPVPLPKMISKRPSFELTTAE